MSKTDYKKEYKHLYAPSAKEVTVVDVPGMNYIMIDGLGAPDGQAAMEAFETLFPVAYAMKFMAKGRGNDYGVMPLEGLWWADDMNDFINNRRDRWKWTYMIMQPPLVTLADYEEAVDKVRRTKAPAAIDKLRFDSMKEGRAAQLLHIGPFADEGPNIQKIHEYIHSIGGHFDGQVQKHHEIYLSDLRRVAPEKMKTVLRQPFV